jgi:hypothetical protein
MSKFLKDFNKELYEKSKKYEKMANFAFRLKTGFSEIKPGSTQFHDPRPS